MRRRSAVERQAAYEVLGGLRVGVGGFRTSTRFRDARGILPLLLLLTTTTCTTPTTTTTTIAHLGEVGVLVVRVHSPQLKIVFKPDVRRHTLGEL